MILTKVTKKQGWFCPWPFCMWGINVTNTRIFCVLSHPACGGVIPVSPSPRASQKRDRVMGPTPPPPRWAAERGGDRQIGTCRMAKGLKDPCPHVAGVGGQYKMYNSLIFINFISRSKKVKPKMLTCVWSLCSANKLLRLWHFLVSST